MALVVVPVILFLIGLEIYMRTLPNEYRYKSEWMEKNGDSVETIVLGSSKAYYGIRPDCLSSKAFNLATISGRPDYDYWVLQKYAGKCKSLKLVIYNMFYELFFDPPFEECEEWPRASYYKIYWGCPRHSALSRYALEISSIFAIKEKLSMNRGDDGMPCDSLGFGLQMNSKYGNPELLSSEDMIKNAVKKHTATDYRYMDYNYGYVERIAKVCKENNLRLILVSTPCTKKYMYLCKKNPQYSKFMELANKLTKDFGLEFVDFNQSDNFADDDFYDSNHLNEIGAKKLSLMLDSIIESNNHK